MDREFIKTPILYCCKKCWYGSHDEKKIVKHLIRVHCVSRETIESGKKDFYEYGHCSYECAFNLITRNYETGPFFCPKCGEKKKNISKLVKHLLTENGEDDNFKNRYECLKLLYDNNIEIRTFNNILTRQSFQMPSSTSKKIDVRLPEISNGIFIKPLSAYKISLRCPLCIFKYCGNSLQVLKAHARQHDISLKNEDILKWFDISNVDRPKINPHPYQYKGDETVEVIEDVEKGYGFKCPFCEFIDKKAEKVKQHVISNHRMDIGKKFAKKLTTVKITEKKKVILTVSELRSRVDFFQEDL